MKTIYSFTIRKRQNKGIYCGNISAVLSVENTTGTSERKEKKTKFEQTFLKHSKNI